MTEPRPVVIDAGPIIHLDELGCLDLLADFPSLHTTKTVWAEVVFHRPSLLPEALPTLRLHGLGPRSLPPDLSAQAVAFDLDAGELSALRLMAELTAQVLLCDDAAARLVAESRGHRVHGTVGVIVRAMRRGLRRKHEVRALLQSIPERSALHLTPSLLREVCQRLDTEA